jgi:hypothetical protein
MLPVSQDAHSIGNVHHLFQPVRDVDDRAVATLESANDFEQPRDLDGRERGRRFVHDEELGTLRDRSRDFNHLSLGDTEALDGSPRVEIHTEIVQDVARALVDGGPVDSSPPRGHPSDEEILGNVQLRK